MKAVVIDDTVTDRPLVYREVPEPPFGDMDLLIAVRAAGVNRADLRRAAGHFAASEKRPLSIAGLELAGEVIAVGKSVSNFASGDRVMAMAGSAYAEQAVVDARLAIPVPRSFDWHQAAATPISFITAYDALTAAADFKKNESVLVQGASSGAGIATVQVARWLGAREIFGTAGSRDKLDRLVKLGCTVPIDYKTDNIVSVILQKTDMEGVDVVIDVVGAHMAQVNIDAAATGGRIVCLGRVAGSQSTVNLDEFSRKRLRMIGVTFRTRSLEERIAVIETFRNKVLPALDDGSLRPVVDSVLPLTEAARAQEYMRDNRHFGKIVLIT